MTVCSAVPSKKQALPRPPCWKAVLENYRYLSVEIKTLATAWKEWLYDNWMIYVITANYVKIPIEKAHVQLCGRFFSSQEVQLLLPTVDSCLLLRPIACRSVKTGGRGPLGSALVVKTTSSRLKGPR